MRDFAIVAPDPGFAGGGRALTEALWRAVEGIGREPELHFLRNPRLPGSDDDPVFTRTRVVRSPLPFPDLVAYKLWVTAPRIADRLRNVRACFVCAAVAPYGYGAALSRRSYGCWLATGAADEWASRRGGLDRLRRTAHAVNAPLVHKLERETLRRARVLWTISSTARDAVAEAARIPSDRIRVVRIPVDTQHFSPLPDDEWERELEEPQLVFVGRSSDPRKNVTLLLDAFVQLRSHIPRARLTLVGAPPSQHVPDGVDVLGEVPSVAEPLRRASLFVLPSLQEGFGLVVAEALASGVPAIVTPSGGPEELIRESGGGEVLSSFSADELADRVEALLSDGDRLGDMRRRGRAYVVREHDPSHLRDALRGALEELGGG
jgi:glycosyltransferase involved in cell wall biosynthesis